MPSPDSDSYLVGLDPPIRLCTEEEVVFSLSKEDSKNSSLPKAEDRLAFFFLFCCRSETCPKGLQPSVPLFSPLFSQNPEYFDVSLVGTLAVGASVM